MSLSPDQYKKLSDIMRWVDAYAHDYATEGKLSNMRQKVESEIQAALSSDSSSSPTVQASNLGHGHVIPRPDGFRARCGGPSFCKVCRAEQGLIDFVWHNASSDYVMAHKGTLKMISNALQRDFEERGLTSRKEMLEFLNSTTKELPTQDQQPTTRHPRS
ncbi:MAG TPA: hypothetical protein VFM18_13385 [Methanosarcina sp.]|nr:hypothetical protein [Methanosarcina sp.]